MEVPSVLATTQTPPKEGEPLRRSANYHPTVWGDHFLVYDSDSSTDAVDVETVKKHRQLMKDLSCLIYAVLPTNDDPPPSEIQALTLIDDIQRLGVSYHFESEIDHTLQHIYHAHYENDQDEQLADTEDLHVVALRFRLLRERGYNVSSAVFNKFKDNEGFVLNESHAQSVQGLVSFYEAAQLRIHGEDLLDEAHAFTSSRLDQLTLHLSPDTVLEVKRALERPIHKGLQRLMALHFMNVITIEEGEASQNYRPLLLQFAKLDFNLLQRVHQKELASITRWWKELDFAKKLPFARDRVVECYFWILGVYFEPQRFLGRKITTKVISMLSIMDDIYDVYGTLEELELLTVAIERWDIDALGQLPEYMREFYRALLNVYDEIENDMTLEEMSYGVYYAKEAMKRQARAYMEEARWLNQSYVPTMEEYMKVALVSTAYSTLTITALLGMGNMATKGTFEWAFNEPKILKASQIICRLMDDKASHKNEQKRGHVASAVECYMNQYGASEEEAYYELDKQITNAWKDLNEECLKPTIIPMTVLELILNLTRVIDFLYKDGDNYSESLKLKNPIASMLIDSVPI